MGVCMSPSMILSLQRSLGENFDSKVKSYKKALEEKPADTLALLEEIKKKKEQDEVFFDAEDDLSGGENFTPEVLAKVSKMLEDEKAKREVDNISDDVMNQVISDHKKLNFPFFKLVGDNIDYEIHARVQTKEHGNQSIHWTHQYAIRDTVIDPLLDNSKPQKSLDQLQLVELLPTPAVQSRLKHSWAILVSRVVTKHLKEFEFLKSVVVRHIPHPHSTEVSQKSEMCCLGMEFFNPNKAGEMAQLLMKNQQNYVPCCGEGESKKVVTPIPFHGDQLFEERARNVIGTFQDGDNEIDRLEGLHPEFADWHAKVTLYEVRPLL
ncbi:Translation initiation factor [Desmophyllum pertusum]|uniref:Translation initiation factor n=1 Tax=Desmophyllum pertusum TaxID=174260 RepID=A0A9W9YCW6_9CNID|nr:Translation initiation factor [Desmophyllum pertusum]